MASTLQVLVKLYVLLLLAAAVFATFASATSTPLVDSFSDNIIQPLSQFNPLCAATEKEGALQLLLILVLLAIAVVLIFLLHRFHVHWFPESIGVILIGVIVGLILRFMPVSLNSVTRLDPQIFFEILLPAIIFEAGYTLEKEDFFYNIGSIILFAFVGTVISTIVVASGIYILGYWGLFRMELGLVDCLLFGSLISAVDPVATLAIFSALQVNPTLHYLVFGESIVNDAVAITLFT
jgi:sodium/hydrogen exchanger 8